MASWEEVKALAADFKKVQLSGTTQRLSERNCIEIVSWLLNKKYVDLIFTSDGKEYLTSSQLVQDIRDELYVSGGRVNFVDLAKAIGVDLSHITNHVSEVVRGQKDVFSILGQLVDQTYITKIASEINEKLSQQGQININELTIYYDLPADFIQNNVVEKYLGKIIYGEQDKNDSKVYFTEAFIAEGKAKIAGCLVGLTRPTSVSVILSYVNMNEKLFFSLFDQVASYGILTSRMQGAVYIPNIYSKSQAEWVGNFYKQNGYLEFDGLTRIGILDYKTYLKKQFVNEDIVYLKSCIASESIFERIEADVVECISSNSYVDLQNSLPSVFNDEDIKMIVDKILTAKRQKQVIVLDNYIVSRTFLESLTDNCQKLIQDKAKSVVASGQYQKYQTELMMATSRSHKNEPEAEDGKADKRDDRRKKASGGKSGGGTQGRETKTKSTKKLYRVTKTVDIDKSDEDDERKKKLSLEILAVDDIAPLIAVKLEKESLDELLDSVVSYVLPSLNETALETAAKLYASTVSDRSASRKHTHNDVQSKVNVLLGDIRLFEKGLKLLPHVSQSHLCKYLLKALGGDIINEILNYIASEEGLLLINDSFTNEQKLKFINDLPANYKTSLQSLLKAVSGHSIETFTLAVEESLASCSMIVKKIDKKKDRVLILNHKDGLLNQLETCEDPALVLHLSTLVIFINATQNIIHASGRHVVTILSFLKQYLSAEHFAELTSYYDLVTLLLNNSSDADNIKEQLKEKLPLIKSIAIDFKKVPVEKQ